MITTETNQVKSKFFDNLSQLVCGLTLEDFLSIKINKGTSCGTVLDYLKVFDRQFIDPETKEIRTEDEIFKKNFYSFNIELFYIRDTNELKVLDFGKRRTRPPALVSFQLTHPIHNTTISKKTNTKTLKDYLSIKEQEKRFLFIFDKIKNKAIKTLEFWISIDIEEQSRFSGVLASKFPIEFISDKELELFLTNCYNKSDKSMFEFLLKTLKGVTNSKSEFNRIEKIYKMVLRHR